jgi:hypothetical protein
MTHRKGAFTGTSKPQPPDRDSSPRFSGVFTYQAGAAGSRTAVGMWAQVT